LTINEKYAEILNFLEALSKNKVKLLTTFNLNLLNLYYKLKI